MTANDRRPGRLPTSALVVVAAMMLAACPPTPKPPRLTAPLEQGPWGEELEPDVKQYLEAVHRKVHQTWVEGVIRKADTWLPVDDPANDPRLVTQIEVRLRPADGQPREVLVRASSGHEPFDSSAVETLRAAAPYPALPAALAGQHVNLLWRLHRDGRLAHPRFARLDTAPMSAVERFRLALSRDHAVQALQILEQAAADRPAVEEMLEALGEAALANAEPTVRCMAVQVVAPRTLDRMLWRTQDAALWDAVLAELVARKAADELVATLAAAGIPTAAEGQRRVLALLAGLQRLRAQPGNKLLDRLLSSTSPRIATAAAQLCTDGDSLRQALGTHGGDPAHTGPIAVALRALGPESAADGAIRTALDGSGAHPTLDAICYHKLVDLAPDVGRVIRNSRQPEDVRVAAARTIACLGIGIAHLYHALRDSSSPVVLAAIAAIAAYPAVPAGASFRLADLAARARGPARVAALAALGRLGQARFADNVLRRIVLLGPGEQAEIAPALTGYGDRAVPTLLRLAGSANEQVAAAAVAALNEIGTPRAREALATLGQQPTHASASKDSENALLTLLRRAAALRK